jgi:cytochrome P450
MTTNSPALPTHQLFTPEALVDPMPLLRDIQSETPISWVPELNGYFLTRHAEIVAALMNPKLSANGNLTRGLTLLSAEEQQELSPLRESSTLWMGHTNDEDHARFQKLLKRFFTPATVESMRPRAREFTHEVIDAAAGSGRMDVVRDLAYPLPAYVIAEMFGMPRGSHEMLQTWSHDLGAIFTAADISVLRRTQQSMLEMEDYIRPLLAERANRPQDDLLSTFAAAIADGVVTEQEAVANCVVLLSVGHETTVSLIANGIHLLLENPDQLALLRSEPELMSAAVDEMIRMEGPAGFVVRVSTEPGELAGHSFGPGEYFFLSTRIGNRDPRVFPEPDRFDITRKPNRHLGFGAGALYCLGAALARMEADECFRIVLERMPALRAGYDTPAWQPIIPFGHRLETLPIEF